MGDRSAIEWTDATWNPIRGCSRVSQGCVNCYAERYAARFSGPGMPYEGLATLHNGGRWTGKVRFVEEHLRDPLHWRRPRRVFVNSMSDLFHENLREQHVDRIFAVMFLASTHRFQILTKRADRMLDYMLIDERVARVSARAKEIAPGWDGHLTWPLRNVWLGVSAESQATADERIPLLLRTPAAVRFVSAEPLLGPVDFEQHWAGGGSGVGITGLDWIIVGGESGPGARPMEADWARAIRDQCREVGVPFFFKQWGGRTPKAGGRVLDGLTHDDMPAMART